MVMVWKMAQLDKVILCKHGDLSSDHRQSHKQLPWLCLSPEHKGPEAIASLAGLEEMMSSRLILRPCLKK